jgi:pseudaminic acid biosynthesis-associated methylase
MNKYKTDQENFWAESFGDDYIERNQGSQLLASNLNFFNKALQYCKNLNSAIEFGANIGMNLKAIQLLLPQIELKGVEINQKAVTELAAVIGQHNAIHSSIFDFNDQNLVDLTLIKGVLIHINPDMLPVVYEKLYKHSKQYILIAEYYNPSPVNINYRGHEDRLFKRDFAGEMLEKYPDLELVDYGFSYRKDPVYPQDDITWFLLKK